MDLTGRKFYSLEVIEKIPDKRINGSVAWKCKCDCGKIVETNTKALTSHQKKSCGCTRYRTYSTGELKKFSTKKKLLEEILKTNYEILKTLEGEKSNKNQKGLSESDAVKFTYLVQEFLGIPKQPCESMVECLKNGNYEPVITFILRGKQKKKGEND